MTKTKEKSLYSVWFVVPSLAIFLIFFLWPVISSLYYSMTVWNFETATFNGLENYKLFFTDPAMSSSVPHTLLYVSSVVPASTSSTKPKYWSQLHGIPLLLNGSSKKVLFILAPSRYSTL